MPRAEKFSKQAMHKLTQLHAVSEAQGRCRFAEKEVLH